MKQKILFLVNKLTLVKKVILGVLLLVVIGVTIYCNSLTSMERSKIRALLGDKSSKVYLITTSIRSYCEAKHISFSGENTIKKETKELLRLGKIIYSLGLFDGFYDRCIDNEKTRLIRNIIDRAITEYYKDYDTLEEQALKDAHEYNKNDSSIGDSYTPTRLAIFYTRNFDYNRQKKMISKIISICYNEENEMGCLAKTVDKLEVTGALYLYYDSNSDEMFKRLIALSNGEKKKHYKFLFAKLLLKENDSDSQGLSIINELVGQNYGKAFLFLVERYISLRQPELTAKYIFNAQKSGMDWQYTNLAFYLLYNEYPELYKKHHNGEYTNSERINLLQYTFVAKRIGYPYLPDRDEYNKGIDYALQLADLYLKEKIEYIKAKEIYEKIIREDMYTPNGNKSLIRLGDIFYQGLGVRQDLKKARDYYGEACDLGHQEACDKFREVNEKIR